MKLLAVALALVSLGCEAPRMGLPDGREHTYGPEEPIRSVDINAIQDAIAGAKRTSFWRYQVIPRGWLEANVTFDVAATYGTGQIAANAGGMYYAGPCLIDIAPGDRITGVLARIYGTGGAQTVEAILSEVGAGDTVATIGNIQAVDPAAAWNSFSDLTPTRVVPDLKSYFWKLHAPLNTTKFGILGVRIDRL